MRNIIYVASIVAMAFLAVSCNEKIDADLNDEMGYITITTQVEPQVKAGYEGTTTLPSEFYIDITQNSEVVYQGNVRRDESSSNSNRYYFLNGATPQWNSNNLNNVSIKAVSVGGYDRSTGVMSISTDQQLVNSADPESAIKASDLLGAKTNDGITVSGNNINVSFRHLMSKLYVKYNKSSSINISKITLQDICTKGGYSFAEMDYANNVNLSYDNIDMLHNSTAQEAEAIFFPYKARTNPSLKITTTDGKEIPCSISLDKIGGEFVAGKRYILNIIVSGSSIEGAEITMVKDWNPDSSSIQISGESVLWIGTSIPAGNALLSYPMLVQDGMNDVIVHNKAVGGSLVCTQPNSDWVKKEVNPITQKEEWNWNYLLAGGLSQTIEEGKNRYESKLEAIAEDLWPDVYKDGKYPWSPPVLVTDNSGVRTQYVTDELTKIANLSYQSLILPYIDGTKASCTTVILDHGYNDKDNMIFVGGAFPTASGDFRTRVELEKLRNHEMTMDEFGKVIIDNQYTYIEASYFHSMAKVIEKIKEVDEDIRIIIGNYFTLDNPQLRSYYQAQNNIHGEWPDYADFTKLICYYNEAIAGYFDLPIVNVYKYLSIDDEMFYNPNQIPDYSKFCPDGVHPSNPSAVRAIADIYLRELDGVIGSRD